MNRFSLILMTAKSSCSRNDLDIFEAHSKNGKQLLNFFDKSSTPVTDINGLVYFANGGYIRANKM